MKKIRKVPTVNVSSMADIAFLLLAFFLVVTAINHEIGILTKLPPYSEAPLELAKINERNVLEVFINNNNELMVEKNRSSVSQLEQITIDFVDNNGFLDCYSECPQKAVVSLQHDRGANYDTYIQVFNELKSGYNFLKDKEAQKLFNKDYDMLSLAQKKIVKEAYPVKISEAEPVDLLAVD